MRAVLCLGFLAGCGDEDPRLLEPELSIDVVVSHRNVVVYFNNVDQSVDENRQWPQPGQCVVHDDVITINGMEACVSEISLDGVEARLELSDPSAFLDVAVSNSSSLTLRTCGGRVAKVPLHAGDFPVTTVSVTPTSDDAHVVAWNHNPAAPTTVVASSTGFGGDVCHVAGRVEMHAFDFPITSFGSFYVQPLLSVEVTETALGELRVWYGDRFFP